MVWVEIIRQKRGGLRKGGKTGHLRSENDYPNFKGRMMEAPRNIRTVIISIVNMESVESGCQLVLIHPFISIHANATQMKHGQRRRARLDFPFNSKHQP
jgi:hypothetical protein